MTEIAGGSAKDTAASEILANALRLYKDAELLLEHERYGLCISLSVLAVEELAKFISLRGLQPLSAEFARLANLDYEAEGLAPWDEIVAMLMDDGSMGPFVEALQSVPDKMKQTGFYVDLGRDLQSAHP